eukprot:TRINITY_DN2427_c0_g1_i5.p1 TRINITY_DN2427_c0_g1~~TRINITY_DN2427_c0_g1_i5.p1  ORF type:complete len:1066 (-),score=226.52 TRINITY_DN2427_c0_g1_i5:155-3352(-)
MPKDKPLRNQKLRAITIERAEKFVSKDYWKDINLFSKLYRERRTDCVKISVYSVLDTDINRTDRVSFSEAMKQKFEPVEVGKSYGPSWATHWFKVHISIPNEFRGEVVHFLWDNGSEALVYVNGIPTQSLYGGGGDDRREEFVLTRCAEGGEEIDLVIEMACNGMFGNPASGHFLNPPVEGLTFTHSKAEVAVLNSKAWQLFWDFDIIIGMAKELPKESARSWEASAVLEKIMNICWTDDPDTFDVALSISHKFLAKRNGQAQHQITACGHCHIDTAWLWPFSETRRKCARSWSNQITLMEEFPEYVFAASQAQQYEWVQQNYPELFKRIKDHPRFIHTGGTWVEMDANIPSGESMVRQFLYGQRFFEREMGSRCTEFWLPDTFGYCSQLPQIVLGSGMKFFLTQKLSWNLINKFPHNTFFWKGLDGSQILCHFPPADTYCSSCSVKDLFYTVENHKNKDTTNHSVLLFGFGDGGGGPTRPLLERLKRVEDCDQMPVITYQPPLKYFEKVEKEETHPVWVGELFFELHNGTYTTQALCKFNNRKSEFLLNFAEFLSSLALVRNKDFKYPKKDLDRIWKLVLLNQFHDVIPGTSIGAVYKDVHEFYEDVMITGKKLIERALETLTKDTSSSTNTVVAYNSLGWERECVVRLPSGVKGPQKAYTGLDSSQEDIYLGYITTPSLGWRRQDITVLPPRKVTVTKTEDANFLLENDFIRVLFTRAGVLKSVFHKEAQREAIAVGRGGGGNTFVLFEDMPFFWDAWDTMIYHLDKYRILKATPSIEIVEDGPLRVALAIEIPISYVSTIRQVVYLDAVSSNLVFDTQVDWHENRKFLKVEFPLNVANDTAAYSVQFGHTNRPTHTNTSWDMAKFEVCGHHWGDLSEYGFGVGLLNDSKYGYACHGNILRLSLLRSSKQPDANADMGIHRFSYALLPHKGDHRDANLARHGYELNQPVLLSTGINSDNYSAFSTDRENVIIETIKRVEGPLDCDVVDSFQNAIIVRLWESLGGRCQVMLKTTLPLKSVALCNLLEDQIDQEVTWKPNVEGVEGGTITLHLTPFQIVTLRCNL